MSTPPGTHLVVEHDQATNQFSLVRLADGKRLPPVALPDPHDFPVAPRPEKLMPQLAWYLERFLEYPFPPELQHAEDVEDALKQWGQQAFNALFDRRDASDWLQKAELLRIRANDPQILGWPWEALHDPQKGPLSHHCRVERCPDHLQDPPPLSPQLPQDRVNILLVVARPYEEDVRFRSLARLLVELVENQNLPAHVELLRPPTFDNLRQHLHDHPHTYHVLHFDGHGTYSSTSAANQFQFKGPQGQIVFENENGEPDPKTAKQLAVLLRDHAVPAVVLNACQAAMLDGRAENPFASVAGALLQSGIRSVVAMSYSLYVSAAQQFLPAFYRRLFEEGSIAGAVRAGRQQMFARPERVCARGLQPLQDWLLPVLYQQDPLPFTFATDPGLRAARESRLPPEVRDYVEPYGFIGRDGALLALERALHRRAPAILIRGLGGAGKTTLARGFLRWLDQTGGLDAAFWFDFRNIRSSGHVLNTLGEAFYGEKFRLQDNPIELLAAACRQVRTIIVWDNFESATENLPAEDRAQLSQLLDALANPNSSPARKRGESEPTPAPKRGASEPTPARKRGDNARTKVIITSRSPEEWLRPEQRQEITLPGLDGEERWEYAELILRELGLEKHLKDPELKNLLDQLRGHPLALRAVLPRLAAMSPAQIAKALTTNISALGLNENEEQGRLFATLRFVEQGIPAASAPLLELIGLHEAYVDADYLAAMAKQFCAIPRPDLDRTIALLSAAGLLRDIGNNTHELHPLLTSYLRQHRTAGEPAQRAFVDIMGNLADQLAPKEEHEQRVPFLLFGSSFRHALTLAERFAMDQAFAALTQSLAAYSLNTRAFGEAERLFAHLARHASERQDHAGEASAYHQLGIVAQEQRDFAAARDWYLKSLAIKEKQGKQHGAANSYGQLGILAQELRDFPAARDWYLKALAIFAKQGDQHGAAATYHQLGIIAQQQRDFPAARDWYLKSLAIKEKLGIEHYAASTYHQLGRVAEEQSDFPAARDWYLKSLAIKEKHGDQHGAAGTYHQLGVVAEVQRDFAAARDWYLKSLAISEKLGIEHYAAITYHQLGSIAQEQRDFAAARDWYLKSLAISEKHGDHHGAASTYGQLGLLAREQQDFRSAGEMALRALAIFAQYNDPHGASMAFRAFLDAHQAADPETQKHLEAQWQQAGLGPFPPNQS